MQKLIKSEAEVLLYILNRTAYPLPKKKGRFIPECHIRHYESFKRLKEQGLTTLENSIWALTDAGKALAQAIEKIHKEENDQYPQYRQYENQHFKLLAPGIAIAATWIDGGQGYNTFSCSVNNYPESEWQALLNCSWESEESTFEDALTRGYELTQRILLQSIDLVKTLNT